MGLLSSLFSNKGTKIREEATRMGFTITDIEREVPIFSHNMKSLKLESMSCVRYALPRRGFAPRVTWSLLQRTKELGASLPNNYLLNSNGSIPEALKNELIIVAETFSEEYFEFEGTDTEVVVYFEEGGGIKEIHNLHSILSKLSSW